MNATSTLELETKLESRLTVRLLGSLRRVLASNLAALVSISGQISIASSRKVSGYRLGEKVGHARFGSGQVLAHWPDGRLLIRFDRAARNRLVWPSLLDCR